MLSFLVQRPGTLPEAPPRKVIEPAAPAKLNDCNRPAPAPMHPRMTTPSARFDAREASKLFFQHGHTAWLGLKFTDMGENWVELELPWRADLVGDSSAGVLASGPIISLMDMASGMAIWQTRGTFQPVATLDLRVDYQRPARERASVRGRVECYRITRSAAFVRGIAYDDDPDDPVAHVAGVFMTFDGEAPQLERAPDAPRTMLEGDLPAYARALGILVTGEEDTRPVVSVDFGGAVEGRPGFFHGGATAGLLETAGYAALRAALAARGQTPVIKPINITVQYLAAGRALPAHAVGRITRLGRRNANIAIEAWQDDRQRLIATAVLNVLIV